MIISEETGTERLNNMFKVTEQSLDSKQDRLTLELCSYYTLHSWLLCSHSSPPRDSGSFPDPFFEMGRRFMNTSAAFSSALGATNAHM